MTIVLLITVLFLDSVLPYELTVLHVNDIHVRMDETNKYSTVCKEKDKKANNCYGGISRLHRIVKDLRSDGENVLWVNAGDFYQGTPWYSQFKWRVVSLFNNMLDFDAITLETTSSMTRLQGSLLFLKAQKAPVVLTNINHTQVPQLSGLYVKSLVKTIGDRKVGLVGYLTPKTVQISNPEQLIFIEEVEALSQETQKLHEAGVDIIIALGHSGYEKDLEVARKVPHLDMIVGGHSHSFLYTETEKKRNPSVEDVIGPYPTLVDQTDGGKVLVVQAYAFTKYLGKVDLKFSETGELISWLGDPILLDSSVQKDVEMEKALQPWREKLSQSTKIVIGQTDIFLGIHRNKESVLGDLLADIMIWSYSNKTFTNDDPVTVALVNSGSIRAPIEEGDITKGEIVTSFPFQNSIDVITIKGRTLVKALEYSVSELSSRGEYKATGKFLQVSGLQILYDLRKPVWSRLDSVKVLNGDGEYTELDRNTVYNVAVMSYIATGGDGYDMLQKEQIERYQGLLDSDLIEDYLTTFSPIQRVEQGRIDIIIEEENQPSSGSAKSSRQLISTLFVILLVCIL